MFCKHKWKIISEKTTESMLEIAIKKKECEFNNIPRSFYTRTHIVIACCDICGKIKKFETEV